MIWHQSMAGISKIVDASKNLQPCILGGEREIRNPLRLTPIFHRRNRHHQDTEVGGAWV